MSLLEKWLFSWTPDSPPLLVRGGIGVGKTHQCREAASRHGYQIQELELNELLNINAQDCFSPKKLLIIDDLDVQMIIYAKALTHTKKIIKTALKPLIIITSSDYNASLIPIMKLCKEYKINKPSITAMTKILSSYNGTPKHKKQLCLEANGDIRYALINTIILSEKKCKQYDIFTITKNILSPRYSSQEKELFFSSDADYAGKMLYCNYPKALSTFQLGDQKAVDQMASYADDLSAMDIWDRYIKENGEWGMYPMIGTLAVGRTNIDFQLQSAQPCKYSFRSKAGEYDEISHFHPLSSFQSRLSLSSS